MTLVKAGSGTQVLTRNNTYTGNTTVSGGQLLVNGTHSTVATYSISGGLLGGTGTVYSVVNVASGAALGAAGTNATGRFTLQNDATLNGGAALDVDIQGTDAGQPSNGYDQLVVAAGKTLTIGNNAAVLTLRVPAGTTLPIGGTFTIVSGAYTGSQLKDLSEGAQILAGGYAFAIHYGSGAITLTSRRVDHGTVFFVR